MQSQLGLAAVAGIAGAATVLLGSALTRSLTRGARSSTSSAKAAANVKLANPSDFYRTVSTTATHKVITSAEMCRVMLPDDANPAGNVHGGTILKMVELAGYIVAARHSNSVEGARKALPVSKYISHMDFHQPMFIGEVAHCCARVVYTSDHTVNVVVDVYAENIFKNNLRHTNTADLWYCALDLELSKGFKPGQDTPKLARIPPLEIETEEEQELWDEGHLRFLAHKRDRADSAALREDPMALGNLANVVGGQGENAKLVSESCTELVQVMLPSDCTSSGVVHGGTIMKLMDNAAGIVAARHCHTNIVTASIDGMSFEAPIFNGNVASIKARPIFTSRKSMAIGVDVYRLTMQNEAVLAVKGIFTFVSLGPDGKTLAIPPLRVQTDAEKLDWLREERKYEERKNARIAEQNKKAVMLTKPV
eukprot:GFYU01003540.1.p1 GENE.GFYU01003540.1~~GFYU01003540.1.p1  ORF type:complete len:422 (+),score=107.89 GFYU01003540.1:109-1374(+)